MLTIRLAALAAIALSGAPALAQSAPAATTPAAPAAANPSLSQEDVDLLRRDIAATRRQIVSETLRLTPDQSARFWPLYDSYQQEVAKLAERKGQMVKLYGERYGKFDGRGAINFVQDWWKLDVEFVEVRQRWLPKFEAAIGGISAATFGQIDSRLTKLIDLQLATSLPLLQFQADAAK